MTDIQMLALMLEVIRGRTKSPAELEKLRELDPYLALLDSLIRHIRE